MKDSGFRFNSKPGFASFPCDENRQSRPRLAGAQAMDSFVIHHLTDIHIGPMQYAPSVHEWIKKYRTDLKPGKWNVSRYIQHLKKQKDPKGLPDLVVISGDLTSVASDAEMDEATAAIQEVVEELKKKPSDWRPAFTTPPFPPFVVIVPGNHDLRWTEQTQEDKRKPFAKLADILCGNGEVLSSTYAFRRGPAFFDFGNRANICLYLLDSTSLGGIFKPDFQEASEKIAQAQQSFDALLTNVRNSSTFPNEVVEAFKEAKDLIEKHSRIDPGAVDPDAQEAMKQRLIDPALNGRLKIAVLHHNPTTDPSDAMDAFDVMLYAGKLKQALAASGVDLVLYGHRHTFYCSRETFPSYGSPPQAQLKDGMLFIGGDSLGCKPEGPFVEISLGNLPAHQTSVPACLLSVHKWAWNESKQAYEGEEKPAARSILSTPIYSSLDLVARNIGRVKPFLDDENDISNAIATVLPPIEQLRARIVDWSDGTTDWIEAFHEDIVDYHGIYATDLSYERSSTKNVRFLTYVRRQFVERLKRLRARKDKVLSFSPPVHAAINKNNWHPSLLLYSNDKIVSGQSPLDWNCEVVRILIRPFKTLTASDAELIYNLDFEHRIAAIPLFIIDEKVLSDEHIVDIAVAKNQHGEIIKSFQYNPARKLVEITSNKIGKGLYDRFVELLANDDLMTVEQFIHKECAKLLPQKLMYDQFSEAPTTLLTTPD
jgi:3',5'-cyclic AMP phosphodiesterase CpdA